MAVQVCRWFARCVRPAFAHVEHPILGPVPTCRECIARMGLADRIVSPEGSVQA